ncbi:MAG: YceK/YidQ family lipoprotein [Pseudomonas sp.]|uniref:YceK/YidQ family lipoprotein n=1 Tax=Pseudomonas sp. TaxID=306 RepID=UPI0030F0779E
MRRIAAAAALVLLSGCSTMAETFDDSARCGPRPYCGSATDIEVISALGEENAGVFQVLAPLALIDLPFSVVADTLFLPYTLFNQNP